MHCIQQVIRRCGIAFVCVFSLLIPLFFIGADARDDGTVGWYIKKTEDHSQPPLDAPLAMIDQYDGYYLDRHADAEDPVIYLTFDAGYENGNVAKILDGLDAHKAKGAVFVLSHLV